MTEQLLREAQMSFDVAQAEALLAGGDKGGMDQYVDTVLARSSEKMMEAFQPLLFDILAEAGEGEARAFNEDGGFRTADSVGFAFNKANPEAILWARHRSMELVKWISEEGRANLRAILSQAWANGIPVAEAARRMRSELVMAPNHAAALVNFRKKLTENEGQLVTQGGLRYRVPKGGMTPEALEKAAARYEARLRRVRAENIARTETVAASNEGQRQLWLQGSAKGYLSANDKRKWLTTPVGACAICIPMNGQLRGLSEPFMTASGRAVMGPPAHPSCRCSQGMALAADQAPAPTPAAPAAPTKTGWARVAKSVKHYWNREASNLFSGGAAKAATPPTQAELQAFKLNMAEAERAISAEVDRLMQEYKHMATATADMELETVSLVEGPNFKSVYTSATNGLYDPDNANLFVAVNRDGLAGRFAHEWRGQWSSSVSEGWMGTFRHELGHHIHLNNLSRELRGDWGRLWRAFTNKERASLVTQYGATNEKEFFAEAFTIYTRPDYGSVPGQRLPASIEGFMERVFGKRVTQ